MRQRRDEPFLYKKEGEKSVAMVTHNWQKQSQANRDSDDSKGWIPVAALKRTSIWGKTRISDDPKDTFVQIRKKKIIIFLILAARLSKTFQNPRAEYRLYMHTCPNFSLPTYTPLLQGYSHHYYGTYAVPCHPLTQVEMTMSDAELDEGQDFSLRESG